MDEVLAEGGTGIFLGVVDAFAVFAFPPVGQHEAEHNAVAVGVRVGDLSNGALGVVLLGAVLAEQERADRQQAVEPAAGLVEGLADEVGGELLLKVLGVLVRVAPLGEGHRAAVVPAVDDLRHALHLRAPAAKGES